MKALTVYLDFKSPQAYLALGPTLDLARRSELKLVFLPYETRQPVIEPERADETRGETHVRVRQQQRHATCLKYAAVQGIPMHFPETPGDTRCALAAVLFTQPDATAFVQAAFTAYWKDGRDLSNRNTVHELLHDAGYDAAGFSVGDWQGVLAQSQFEAEERGIFDTPMLVLDEQLYLGREQLPLIESQLNSRET